LIVVFISERQTLLKDFLDVNFSNFGSVSKRVRAGANPPRPPPNFNVNVTDKALPGSGPSSTVRPRRPGDRGLRSAVRAGFQINGNATTLVLATFAQGGQNSTPRTWFAAVSTRTRFQLLA